MRVEATLLGPFVHARHFGAHPMLGPRLLAVLLGAVIGPRLHVRNGEGVVLDGRRLDPIKERWPIMVIIYVRRTSIRNKEEHASSWSQAKNVNNSD